jgi:uncharacterized alkaline shock family protein YloU
MAHLWLEQNDIKKPTISQLFTGTIGQLDGVHLVNSTITQAFQNDRGLTNITAGMNVQGERMFDMITDFTVSPSFDGRGPEITLRGRPSPEGLRILQQIWRR